MFESIKSFVPFLDSCQNFRIYPSFRTLLDSNLFNWCTVVKNRQKKMFWSYSKLLLYFHLIIHYSSLWIRKKIESLLWNIFFQRSNIYNIMFSNKKLCNLSSAVQYDIKRLLKVVWITPDWNFKKKHLKLKQGIIQWKMFYKFA